MVLLNISAGSIVVIIFASIYVFILLALIGFLGARKLASKPKKENKETTDNNDIEEYVDSSFKDIKPTTIIYYNNKTTNYMVRNVNDEDSLNKIENILTNNNLKMSNPGINKIYIKYPNINYKPKNIKSVMFYDSKNKKYDKRIVNKNEQELLNYANFMIADHNMEVNVHYNDFLSNEEKGDD